jgi:hypothetical protein
MVNEDIRDWDTDASEPLQVQNSFVELATGCDPIYVLDRYIDMEDGENYGILIPENKQVYLCLDTRVSKIEMNTPEYTKSFSDYTDHLYVINSSATSNMADFTVTLKDSQTTVQAEVYTCSNEAYQQVIDKLSESEMTDVQVSGNQVSGKINAVNSGILLLTIPYDTGWEILIDGEKTDYECIGNALIGVSLTSGEHTIEMKYTSPGLWVGSFLSLLCVVLYFLSGILEKRLAPKKALVYLNAGSSDDSRRSYADEAGHQETSAAQKHIDGQEDESEFTDEMISEAGLAEEASEDAWKDTGNWDPIQKLEK